MTAARLKAETLLIAAALLTAGVTEPALAISFASGIQTGTIQNSAINEASGIAASRINSNVLWTQEDSGNPAVVYAMTAGGTNLGTYTLSGAGNTDWEDIAVGPGPTAGVQYIYVGDIGDNNWDNAARRSTIAVYRVPEPTVSDTQSAVTATLIGVSKFTLAYPDGAHDAESMFVDPLTKDVYIITKRDTTFKYVYRAAYPQSTSGTATLTLAATLTNANALTAADISPDGSQIIIRSYATTSGLLYTRPNGGSVADAFATTPVAIPLHSETQGEAIGFDPQGRGYYTTSESTSQPIYYFDRLPPPAATRYWDNDSLVAGTRSTSGTGMGGTGSWDTTSLKWYTGSADVPWVDANDAVFWGTAGTVTLSAARTVSSLAFRTSGYTITGSTLTLSGPTVTVDAGVTATIGSIVAGSAGLVKEGAGTLVLTNSSNQTSGYTGGTTINAGTLNVASGTISHSGEPIAINNGATLQFSGSTFTLAAARGVTLGPGGGVVDVQTGSYTIAGPIGGTSLTKTGTGTLTLSNLNTYTGNTIVQAGTLRLNTVSLADAADVDLSSGTTLDLAFSGSDTIRSLLINGAAQYVGTWGAIGSGADFTSSLITGAGWLHVTAGLSPGDFNRDGLVDAADYVLWRKNALSTGQYDAWRTNFGRTVAGASFPAAVPEPTVLLLLLASGIVVTLMGRRALPKK